MYPRGPAKHSRSHRQEKETELPIELLNLPCPYDAREPFIPGRTLKAFHGKHRP
jgi:hypothetical protein